MSSTRLAIFASFAMAVSLHAGGLEEDNQGTETPRRLEITKGQYFGEPTDNIEAKAQFEKFILDRYQIDLQVNAFPMAEYMAKFGLSVSSGDIEGLGWIFGGSYMTDYYHDGATLALDDYVASNSVWLALDEGMRTSNVRNGKLLALPSQWSESLGFVRTIRADWLEILGLDMPQTIDEFYEVCVAFSTLDPDGNGEDDTVAFSSAGVWNLQDIFMSFGVPTNHVGAHAVTPDPNDGFRFNDGMLKPDMAPALEWLNRAYEEDLLDVETFTNRGSDLRNRMASGKYGSTYYWASSTLYGYFERTTRPTAPGARYAPILGLTSDFADSGVNVGGVRGSGAPYVLIAGTEDPEEHVSAFIDAFFSDEIGFLSGMFGAPEISWEFGPTREIVRLNQAKSEAEPARYPGAGIVGMMLPNRTWFHYPLVLEGEDPEESRKRYQTVQLEAELIAKGIESGLLYRHTALWNEPDSETYRRIGADLTRIFETTVANAVTGQISAEDAVREYRTQLARLGGQDMLDEANEAIGKTSSEIYRYDSK